MPLYLHHYAELFCFLTAVICYRKLKGSAFIWFIPFMFLTLSIELLATYMVHVKGMKNNSSVYNFLTTVTFIFYLWFMSRSTKSLLIKRLFLPVTGGLLFAILTNIIFFSYGEFHVKTYIAGCIIIVCFCFIYLFESINKYDIDFRIEREPVFWIIIGLLFFYLAGAGYFIFIKSFSAEFKEQFNQVIRWLSVFMYGCFSLAFILCHPQERY